MTFASVSMSQFRTHSAACMRRAPLVLTKNGKPYAVVLPIETFRTKAPKALADAVAVIATHGVK
jgi:prevent-host-death family protein